VCNGAENKADKFPNEDEGGPLVNPCEDDPEEHFAFHFDRATRLASVLGKTTRGTITEQMLGLNRTELREYRSRRVLHLMALWLYVSDDPEAAELLEDAKNSSAEYAAFARALFCPVCKDPQEFDC
jgi:hypothetical protein